MLPILLLLYIIVKSQIYSLEENVICNDILCNQGSYLNNIYNYGSEDFGDLTGKHFSFQFFIRILSKPVVGQGFIASIMDGDQVILEIQQKNPDTNTFFQILYSNSLITLGSYQSTNWFQIYITQSNIYISDWSGHFYYDHLIQFSSSHHFNLFTQSSTQYWYGYGCCIIMYKGILVNNTYFNNKLYIQLNSKQPETIININVQEKLQSKITNDYSDYEHIIRLGNIFDYDDKDPYLLNDLLLFNGSQYINVYDVYLNYQYTIEFRIKSSTLTNDIQLFQFESLNYYISIILTPALMIIFDLNGQTNYFSLLLQSQFHFCIAIIYYLDEIQLYYTTQFIQFSNIGILSDQSFHQQSLTQFYAGQGTLTIGSSLNQFASVEYFELYHFRFYQGYFIDDQSVLNPICKIYLNDKCLICKSPFQLTENNLCDNLFNQQLITYFNTQHNQYIRQCHTLCATCSVPNICLTCYGIRQSPPDCFCPDGYFEDNVSPNCRKYFQDIQTQTGLLFLQCLSGADVCETINFNYPYKITPKIGMFMIGASHDSSINRISFRLQQVNNNNFQICGSCYNKNQFHQVQWMSSVSKNFFTEFRGTQQNKNDQLFTIDMTNYIGQITYPQILGWQQTMVGSQFQIEIQNQLSNSFQILSLNNQSFIRYQVIYSKFLSLKYTITDDKSFVLDNIPKSIKAVFLLQGLQTNNSTGTFKLMISARDKISLKMQSRLPINKLNGVILFTAQYCQTGICDFYQQYISTCNLNFELCNCNEINYFVNSNNYCEKCDSNCQKCSGLSTNCTQCYSDKQLINGQCACLENWQLFNGICICNPGRFLDLYLQSCQLCHPNCKTCFGSEMNQCLTCNEIKVYNQLSYTCSCNFSQFLDQNYQCVDCHSTCEQCYSINDCKSCENLRTLVINNLNYECVCKSGYFQDDSGNCQQCQISCSECQNLTSCIQCPDKRTFDIYTKQCNCNDGYFEIAYQQNCIKCPQNCITCLNENQCISCYKNSEIYNFLCQCKQGFYNYNNKCESCDTFQGVQDTKCDVFECGDGIRHQKEQCDDGNQLNGDGCNNQCQMEYGYDYLNGSIQQIIYPQPFLIETNGHNNLYNPQRIFQLYFKQELKYFQLDIEQFIGIKIQNKLLNSDYTYIIVDQSQSDIAMKVNVTIYIELLSSFSANNLEIYFKNPQQLQTLEGKELQIPYVQTQISEYQYTDQQTIRLTQTIQNSTYYMLYLIIGLVILSILTGGIQLFYNLLDLFQIISYLKYINTQLPYNLQKYFEIFQFIQIKILDDYFQISQYFCDFNHQLHKSPTKIDDDGITPNLIVNLSSYLVIWLLFIITVMITKVIPSFMNSIQMSDQQSFQTKCIWQKIILLNIKEFIVKQCLEIQNQFFFSGFFRTYLSTAYDLSFYVSLNLYHLSFDDHQFNVMASYLTLIFCSIYFLILIKALNIVKLKSYCLIMDKQKFGSVYEGLKLENRFYKYYNLYQLIKRFIFMINLVQLNSQTLFQITGIIILQIIQVIFAIMKPFKSQLECSKLIISEIIMFILEINILILVIDDYFHFISRSLVGWICIILISLLLCSQIIIDSTQQWQGIKLQMQTKNNKLIIIILMIKTIQTKIDINRYTLQIDNQLYHIRLAIFVCFCDSFLQIIISIL